MRDIYYAMGYAKNFDMYLADLKFELPRMKMGGKAKQTPSMGVSVRERQSSFSPISQISLGPNGENVGKRILDIYRAMTRPPHPSSTAECLCLIACLREEQASAASWEPRPPFEAAKMD